MESIDSEISEDFIKIARYNLHGGKLNNNNEDIDYQKEDFKLFEKYCKNKRYHPPILDRVRRIIAIGDIHGNMKFAINCLKAAKVVREEIDKNGNGRLVWIGGTTVVVQVGDQIDSCRPYPFDCGDVKAVPTDEASDIKILELFDNLDRQAQQYEDVIDGKVITGRVISLLGNHELMNVFGNMNYVSLENLKYFDPNYDPETKTGDPEIGKQERIKKFKPGNKYGKFLGCSRLSSVIVGDFIFVHAGIVPKFLNDNNLWSRDDLYRINYNVRRWLLGLDNLDYVKNIVNTSPTSMFWDRILGCLPNNLDSRDNKCVNFLKPVLKTFDIKSMIIGHTPQFHVNHSGISKTCGDELYRIDVGGSHAFNYFDLKYQQNKEIMDLRKAQVLEILTDIKSGKPTIKILRLKDDNTIEKVNI